MEEQIIDLMDDPNLSPTELISLMFDRTDENGILYIPEFYYDNPNYWFKDDESYRCRVDWNMDKRDKLIADYQKHYEAQKKSQPVMMRWTALLKQHGRY